MSFPLLHKIWSRGAKLPVLDTVKNVLAAWPIDIVQVIWRGPEEAFGFFRRSCVNLLCRLISFDSDIGTARVNSLPVPADPAPYLCLAGLYISLKC
jgi:hypothetical protein